MKTQLGTDAAMMNAVYLLADYPVLAAQAAERTPASRLDGRACLAIYDAALPGIWQSVSDHEREFMRRLGVAGMKARLSLSDGVLIAQLEIGGRIVAGNAHKMAEQLRLAGVTPESLTVTDSNHAPTSGQIIAVKAALRGLPPKTAEQVDALLKQHHEILKGLADSDADKDA